MVDLPLALEPGVALPIRVDGDVIDTPAVLIDLDVVDANIARTQSYADAAGVALRPHIKTHKSPAMARRQLAAGATGVCVAKVSEAQVFIEADLDDVTIAYPVIGRAKLERLAPLIGRARLTLVADSDEALEGYRALAERTNTTLDVLVEVDTGMHRIGLDPGRVIDAAGRVRATPGLSFRGLLTHAGHAHDASDASGVRAVAREEARILSALREELEAAHFEVPVVTAGSTLTAPYLSSDDGITEVRPGTYIYNDLRTVACWSAQPDQIAATMLATVVSANEERITVDAGNKTLTLTREVAYGFGHVLGHPDIQVVRLSEEHGVLHSPTYRARVGERFRILPIHVCVWMDLQPQVYGVRGDQIVERIDVVAMRHSL